jgi:glycogen synthase
VAVTNDWFTGLVAAYHKTGAFGSTFKGTTFFHIFHNLQEAYEGRLYLGPRDGNLEGIHQLPLDYLMDPYNRVPVLNLSRCATLGSDQWATVSPSYLQEILETSPLMPILKRHPKVRNKLTPIALRLPQRHSDQCPTEEDG